jgi:hypothetical protein
VTEAALAAAPSLDPGLTHIDIVRGGERGSTVTVTVTYDDAVRVPLVGWLVGDSVRMTSEAAARQEFG